jgi:LacI family transcriptional regulator
MQGVSDVASHYQYDLLMSSQLTREQELAAYKRLAGGKRVDGVIVMRLLQEDQRIALLQDLGHPFVVLGRRPPSQPSDFAYVDADSQWGIGELMKHFIDYGHEHIGFISAPEEMALTRYRFLGYQEALQASGIDYRPDYVIYGDMLRESGKQATQTLLTQCPKITAIVACNDVMALGAMEAVEQAGLKVGADIAIGGFDDVLWAQFTNPTLTTVRQPVYRMSELVTEMLLQIIDGTPPAQTQVLLQPELMIRESSGSPRC